ncbi:MAG: lipid-A-disaccharide synthase [Pseudomonadota bacterium]
MQTSDDQSPMPSPPETPAQAPGQTSVQAPGQTQALTSGPRLFFVAGEPSGDRLGAALIEALRAEAPGLSIAGIGGQEMRRAGLEPPFDIAELAVMGYAEILPRLPQLMRRLREVTQAALAFQPDALITIDSPGFSLRVAERLRRVAPGLRTIHYVAPSVWAWRPGRAKQMARYIDHVLALLPFEPPYMQAAGMTCDFVGHPIAGQPMATPEEIAAFRAAHGIGDAPLLLVAPGSRAGEVRRHGPVFTETLARLTATHPGLRIVVPVAETVAPAVAALFPNAILLGAHADAATRRAAAAAADAALVKSGTITLEMAAAGTPQVAAYRTSWLTATIARRLLRVDTANLVNLAVGWESGARPVPEFYQENCTPELLVPALAHLLSDTPERAAQIAAADQAIAALGRGGPSPAARAAQSVLTVLRSGPGAA